MAPWEELLERNQKYSETEHKPQPYLSEAQTAPPLVIFSCIDFRVSVETLLNIKSEEAFICRTAGGRVKSCLTDLLFLDTFTEEKILNQVIIIHHTDCGFTHKTDEEIKTELRAKSPQLKEEIDQLYIGTFGSSDRLEESVREDLGFLKSYSLLRQDLKDSAKGYIYDIKSGKLNPVSYKA